MKIATIVPKARNGPNGTAVLRPARPTAISATPTTAPVKKPMNRPDGNEAGVEPTEVCAEQRRQTNVAIAHATAAGEVDDAHERQAQCPRRGASSRFVRARR